MSELKHAKTDKYFSFGCDGEFEFHGTEKEAKDEAESEIEHARNWAADSDWHWPDNTGDICWGEVRGRAVIEDSEPTVEQKAENPEWSYVREVSLETVETNPLLDAAPDLLEALTGLLPIAEHYINKAYDNGESEFPAGNITEVINSISALVRATGKEKQDV